MRKKLLKCIDYFFLNREGFTFRLEGSGIDVPTTGYVVSITPMLGLDDNDVHTIVPYTKKNKKVDVFGEKYMTYIGGWYDESEDEFILDVSIVTDDKDKALEIAKALNQKAIYDLDEEEDIFVR